MNSRVMTDYNRQRLRSNITNRCRFAFGNLYDCTITDVSGGGSGLCGRILAAECDI